MISEQSLRLLAGAPAATKFKHTYEEVRHALASYLIFFAKERHSYEIKAGEYEVYLQGSYANSTNITGESDVDIVIQLNSPRFHDSTQLNSREQSLFRASVVDCSYGFVSFKKDVHSSLKTHFTTVEYKAKSLKIPKNDLRVNADVVPALCHKKYTSPTGYTRNSYILGIKFLNTETAEEVINYPKQHKENCEKKNTSTDGKFKDSVRIFKNFKRYLMIDSSLAPSYYIENLIFNCPNTTFFNLNYQNIVVNILKEILDDVASGRLENYVCANGQHWLFGKNGWDLQNAKNFIYRCVDLMKS